MPLPHSYYSYAWLACWSSWKDTRDSLSCFINSQDYWPSPCLHPWSVSCAFKKSLRAWIYPRVSRRRARICRMDRSQSSCPHHLCSPQASTSSSSAQWHCHPHRVCRYHRFGSMDLKVVGSPLSCNNSDRYYLFDGCRTNLTSFSTSHLKGIRLILCRKTLNTA